MGDRRIVIVGGGIAGVATAWWLARLGAGEEVLLLEAEPGLGRCASGHNAAILRTAIDAPATRALALESAAFLRETPPGLTEQGLLDEVGLIVSEGSPEDDPPPWVAEHVERGEALALSAERRVALAPHWRPGGARSWLLARQGHLDVAHLIEILARGARAGGVEIRTSSRVERLLRASERVEGVDLSDGGRIHAQTVALAAGAWAGSLGAGSGSRAALRVTRRHLVVTGHDPRVDPRWPIVWDDHAGMYARPESGGMLLCACEIQDVDADERGADPEVPLAIAAKAERHLPDLGDAPLAHFWPGLRTLTEDDTPLVGVDPVLEGLFWIAGLGGHGMTVSAALGRVAAQLLLGEPIDPDLRNALSPGRFAPAGRG